MSNTLSPQRWDVFPTSRVICQLIQLHPLIKEQELFTRQLTEFEVDTRKALHHLSLFNSDSIRLDVCDITGCPCIPLGGGGGLCLLMQDNSITRSQNVHLPSLRDSWYHDIQLSTTVTLLVIPLDMDNCLIKLPPGVQHQQCFFSLRLLASSCKFAMTYIFSNSLTYIASTLCSLTSCIMVSYISFTQWVGG
jgi:hypothetical protein